MIISETYIFANDLKILKSNSFPVFPNYISNIEKWVTDNKMDLASDKCAQLIFKSNSERRLSNDQTLRTFTTLRDIGVLVSSKLSWSYYIEEHLCKADKTLYCLPRNVGYRVKTVVKLRLYKP